MPAPDENLDLHSTVRQINAHMNRDITKLRSTGFFRLANMVAYYAENNH